MNLIDKLYSHKPFSLLSAEDITKLKKLAEPSIGIETEVAVEPLPLTASKFGGIPFISPKEDLPRDEANRPYLLLAQFNFEEISSKVGQHPRLPEKGLLQIFIPGFEEDHGVLDIYKKRVQKQIVRFIKETPNESLANTSAVNEYREFFRDAAKFNQEKFSIKWSDKFSELDYQEKRNKIESLSFYIKYGQPCFPLYKELALKFEAVLCPPDGYVYGKPDIEDWSVLKNEELQNYFDGRKFSHNLMGYGYDYVQYDPRQHFYYSDDDVPVELKKYIRSDGSVYERDKRFFLEIYSDWLEYDNNGEDNHLINWWDRGACYFYIQDDDLKNHNLEKLEFHIQS